VLSGGRLSRASEPRSAGAVRRLAALPQRPRSATAGTASELER